MYKIIYKHWKKDKTLEVVGDLPKSYNNSTNDRYVVQLQDGTFEDVIKDTVIEIQKL